MSKICVYAICKNELQFVEQWIENMSEADYIVVLDTGSTDGTFEKLQEDSRVTLVKQQEIKPWRFDVARNESMKLIPDDADILVCTDFDELFEPGWGQYLRDNWIPEYHNRCHYKYAWSHDEKGNGKAIFTYDKIHTRELHWVFPVHEVLWAKDEANYVENALEASESIYLHHWQDTTKSRSNYLPLLELSCKENPNSSHVWSLLTREYLILNEYEKAISTGIITLGKPDIEESSFGLVLLSTLYFVAQAYCKLKNYDEALWYCQEFIRVDPTYREPYFLMAEVFNASKVYTMAESAVLAGRKYGVRKYDWVETQNSWLYEDNAILGAIYINLQQYDKAIEHLKKTLECEPNNIELLKQYAFALENQLNKIA